MKASSSFPPAAQGAADFLRRHERMAALLPAARRIAELQDDCMKSLPAIFHACAVLRFEAGNLVLGTPNAALTAKLKQQLPQLRLALMKRGWQVNSIQTKVQVVTARLEKPAPSKKVLLPELALESLAALNNSLESTPRNAALKDALAVMLKRHQAQGNR